MQAASAQLAAIANSGPRGSAGAERDSGFQPARAASLCARFTPASNPRKSVDELDVQVRPDKKDQGQPILEVVCGGCDLLPESG